MNFFASPIILKTKFVTIVITKGEGNMRHMLLLLLMLGLVACSGGKSTKNTGADEVGIELADNDEFGSLDTTSENTTSDIIADNITQANNGTNQGTYTVQKNETLMMVAFKIYGDYAKWKEIADLNGISGQSISEGQTLSYTAPVEQFTWAPEGTPYLIKERDTLGTISNDTYGTTKYWKNIWENNRPLIKDPNKIFVGFTIFTPTIEGRELANQ